MTLQICKAPKYKPAKSKGLLHYIHIHLSNNTQLVLTATQTSYSRTLDCEQLGLRVFYKTSKNFEGILTW